MATFFTTTTIRYFHIHGQTCLAHLRGSDPAVISSTVKRDLAAAGLLVTERADEQPEGLIPPIVVAQAASCPPGDRRTDVVLDRGDPQLTQKANAGWHQLSSEAGLFSEGDGRFLLGLPGEEEGISSWIQVRLEESWDIAGRGAASLLGSGAGRPEFVALSLDGSVISCGTTGQCSVELLVVKQPECSHVLRRFAESLTSASYADPRDRLASRQWLDAHPVDE
ncbi:hypothetical protein [Dactylosporangium sp. NPDC006015]|uniref:hypothetical protein n=1 Tax=Dactylosporangium sp. NPDC006015 TaxID=3154576 RepID=UPI0033A364B0